MLEKITQQSISGNNVKSTPGQRLTGTVSQNKHVFDKLPELIASALNSIVDALQSATDGDSGADCINITPITGAAGTTVQSILETYKTMLDDVYTKSSIDDQLDDKADKTTVNLSVKSVSLVPETGVLVFTRQDGTTFQIDTLMEKILINFDYDKTTQSLVFTASDGTVQRISISDFITENEFSNSDTVSFSVSDSGVVTAYIEEGSITDAFLSSALKAALIAYRDAAQTAATNATASEANAGQYASSAADSAATATQKATDASGSAAAAAGSAENADTFAKKSQSYAVGGTNTRTGEDTDNSKYYKEQAGLSEASAAGSAEISQAAANTATSKADAAKLSENAAKAAAQTATEKAAAASASASSASDSADAAAGSASTATQKANVASTSATNAANSAAAAENSKTAAAGSATAAQAARTAAEQARDEAQGIVGGDYATNAALNAHAGNSSLHFAAGEKAKLANAPADTNAALSGKVDKVSGKGLSKNDYTDEDKAKVQSALQSMPQATADEYGSVKLVDCMNSDSWSADDVVTVELLSSTAGQVQSMLDNKVEKTGDTITGGLAFKTSDATESESGFPICGERLIEGGDIRLKVGRHNIDSFDYINMGNTYLNFGLSRYKNMVQMYAQGDGTSEGNSIFCINSNFLDGIGTMQIKFEPTGITIYGIEDIPEEITEGNKEYFNKCAVNKKYVDNLMLVDTATEV
ncbi:hypothetical protein AALA22_14505 [Anaerovoracaceae bacterium 41-7]